MKRPRSLALLPGLAFAMGLAAAPLFPQSASLEEEKARLAGLVGGAGGAGVAGGSGPGRDALADMARLAQLAGDTEEAAALWGRSRSPQAPLESARLLIALGEFDKAGELALRIQLSGGASADGARPAETAIVKEARVLGALAGAFKTGDIRDLRALASDPASADYRGEIYYALWKLSGEDEWRTRLAAELPESPEARIAQGGSSAQAAASPHWLLFSGRSRIGLSGLEMAAVSAPASPQSLAASPAQRDAALQTGLYSSEANARAMASRLTQAGFRASVTPRRVPNASAPYWAVTVPGGSQVSETIIRLKDLGVEAFPVF